jgi:predicted dehydrogenase
VKKILIISLGSIGKRHLRNTRHLLPDATIAIWRLHHIQNADVPEGANQVFINQVDALAFKPDAIIVSSPASEHLDNTIPFLKNGSHIFMEKPLAESTSKKVNELVELSREGHAFSMVGYVLRFQPMVCWLKKIIHSRLGEVRTANIEVGQYLPDWRVGTDYRQGASAQKKLGGGALLELSHELDYATWFFGDPDSIYCSSAKVSDMDIDVEDSACVVMDYEFPRKMRAVVQVDFLQRSPCMSVKVVGSEATLFADLIKEEVKIIDASGKTELLDVPKMSTGNEMYLRQFDYFFGKSFKDYKLTYQDHHLYSEFVTMDRGAEVLRLVDSCKESSQSGKKLKFRTNK